MNANQQQVTTLAAIVQVATLVEKLARTGDISSKDSNMLLQAIFVQSPQRFEDVYNHDKQELSLGLSNLEIILGQSTVRISPDIARYTLSLLHLENKLRKQPEMLEALGKGIKNTSRQVEHFGLQHENTIGSLADIYKDTLSKLSFRIQVTGNPSHLQNTNTANKVRTLLLAGIRAAILWRQCGGRRWHLLTKRKTYIKTIAQLQQSTPTFH